MSSISGISSGASIFQYLQRLRNATQTTTSSGTSSTSAMGGPGGPPPGGPPPGGPGGPGGSGGLDSTIEKGLEDQGYSGTNLTTLMTKIDSAITSAMSASQTSGQPADIKSAVENVLNGAGVNVTEFNKDTGLGKTPPTGSQNGDSSVSALSLFSGTNGAQAQLNVLA